MQPEIAAEIDRALSNDRMLVRAFYMIVSTTVIFGAIGALVGWSMAIVLPAYFRDVYDTLESEAWQVGIGKGLSTGLISGVIIGCSVLLATAWYRSRIKSVLIEKYKHAE